MARSVADRLDRGWRIFATFCSFAAFGVGGLLLRLLVFPMLPWLARDGDHRKRLARGLVQRAFACHIELMRRLGVLTYEIQGIDRLHRNGLLVLANHPTLIDVVFLISLLPNADCVINPSVARNIFMRGPARAAGYVSRDEGAGLVDDCIATVRSGACLVIFPEGTRTSPGQRIRLQRGAANIAVRGGLDITPVRITCTPSTLTKGRKWYSVPLRRFHMRLQIGEDIAISPFLKGDPERNGASLAARRVNEFLADYFDMTGEGVGGRS